jgi:putative endonuclease
MLALIKSLFRKRPASRRAAHLEFGAWGERAAIEHLKRREGYKVVATNFRVPLGRGLRGRKLTAEIDVIAYDGDTLAFVEVKTRKSDDVVAPERAVGLRKQRQIARAARKYRYLMGTAAEPYRYDVVTVIPGDGENEIELLRGYFDDRIFQRSRYFNSGSQI